MTFWLKRRKEKTGADWKDSVSFWATGLGSLYMFSFVFPAAQRCPWVTLAVREGRAPNREGEKQVLRWFSPELGRESGPGRRP